MIPDSRYIRSWLCKTNAGSDIIVKIQNTQELTWSTAAFAIMEKNNR